MPENSSLTSQVFFGFVVWMISKMLLNHWLLNSDSNPRERNKINSFFLYTGMFNSEGMVLVIFLGGELNIDI